ncbi:MAG: hypothetical protein ACE5JC_08050 [Candidatus Zixiibacteriota bacterium]
MSGLGLSFQSDRFLLLFLVFFFLLAWSYFLYRRSEAPLQRSTKAVLVALRCLAILAVIFALWQPLLSFSDKVTRPAEIAVLVDTSTSMNFSDEVGLPSGGEGLATTRLEVARGVLTEFETAQLPEEAKLSYWTFSDSLNRLRVELDSLNAQGVRTSMGEALVRLKEQRSDENLSAIVILSDGGNNSGIDPLVVASRLGVPVYAVGIGDPQPPLDVAFGEVDFPEVAYSQIPTKVEFTVKLTSPRKGRAPVFLKSGGKLYGRTDLILSQPGEQSGEIEFIPQETGTMFFQVSIPPQEGEKVTKNNYRSFSVEVLKSKLKVLLVSSRPGWEFAFLKRALEEDPKLEIKPVVYGLDGGFLSGSFPATLEALSEYDILICVDPGYRQLSGREEVLKRYLQRGHSILFLLGEDLSSAKASSVMSELLPLDFAPRGGVVKGPFSLCLTTDGSLHPITRLSEDEKTNRDLWREVPPFEFIVPGSLKPREPRAVVLLTCPLAVKPPRELPAVMVGERYGGKTMVVTVFPLWRWDFLPRGFEGGRESYRQFFTNAVRWLATPLDMERMNIYSENRVYSYGEEISILGKFYDESFQPLEAVESRIEIFKENGADKVERLRLNLVEQEPGRYKTTVPSLSPGRYAFSAEAFWRGKKLGQFGGKFEVEAYSLEEQNLAADFELLKRLGELSGGGFFAPGEVDSQFLLLDFEVQTVVKKSEVQLWNQPWLLGLAVICLALEWIIRKRNQLA